MLGCISRLTKARLLCLGCEAGPDTETNCTLTIGHLCRPAPMFQESPGRLADCWAVAFRRRPARLAQGPLECPARRISESASPRAVDVGAWPCDAFADTALALLALGLGRRETHLACSQKTRSPCVFFSAPDFADVWPPPPGPAVCLELVCKGHDPSPRDPTSLPGAFRVYGPRP